MERSHRETVLRLHTDPRWGSPYWQDRFHEEALSIQSVLDEPMALQPMDLDVLRDQPLDYFLSRRATEEGGFLITGETSGFSGKPVVTAFTEPEFTAGFVTPFLRRAEEVGFPTRSRWLWAGPTGPHIIGKAVREILRTVDGVDPFAVDFDPRWSKKLPARSMPAERYFRHVCEQVMAILSTQQVDVVFSTPPVIAWLAENLSREARSRIRGVHYGGMALDHATYRAFRKAFDQAVHLSGYGNSLFGVFLEEGLTADGPVYGTTSERVCVDIIRRVDGRLERCDSGESGHVMFSRYDESMLILNMVEQDRAVRLPGAVLHPHRETGKARGKLLY